jgi:hypothetical protein
LRRKGKAFLQARPIYKKEKSTMEIHMEIKPGPYFDMLT